MMRRHGVCALALRRTQLRFVRQLGFGQESEKRLRTASFLACGLVAATAAGFAGRPCFCAVAVAEPDRMNRWRDRWAAGLATWHLEDVNPYIVKYWGEVMPAPAPASNGMGVRVLVPLCGKCVDMAFLARLGYRVVGVEGVGEAIEQFAKQYGMPIPMAEGATMHVNFPPEVDPARFRGHAAIISAGEEEGTRREPPPPVILVEGDFLELGPEAAKALVPFDAAFDRGSLVAVQPSERVRYAEVLSNLMAPGGKVLLVAVEHDAFADGRLGPPFEVTEAEVASLFGSTFAVKLLQREDRLEQDAGMKRRGVSRFHECIYLLTKRTAAL
ncbi:unnamed protein product [Polarella glacialis]|uniref:Thiopurine S-methyltransferase n=1 Tax=Polarella glacialis TaxID=89957 RepID=A0A813IMN0_POLGL|nr:unnamed protein product [Polarella glacialis]